MLQSPAIRSLFRGATQCSRSPMLAQRLSRPSSSFSPLTASYRVRFGPQSSFAKCLQVQTFASIPGRDDEQQQLHSNNGKSKKEQIQELIEENAALKEEVEKLKAEIAKKPNKFMGTLQQYGLPFLVWWTSLYLASGVSIYVALDTGLVSGASIIDFIMQNGLDKFIDPARLDPTYGNIAIAVIVNECLEVIRFPITLATLPYIKRVFSRKKVEEAK
ncbi:hypothetical protein F441_18929 [Phytophthora nicotianae CJ01A1]|uniref:DUF1279 domain-containing protein n=5 Tax=Phytophthora nicotianae TaxID=4792 RepID=V9E5G5_PHYNI|nr:hypothetical protein F443_19118 [Phytophthora nicotianae P1569]ETK74710.1 hypothetical protein L915_18542 [Phytophthora nicotianae]ETO63146.1 hypothetical protein F444_19075 [Phytophthora nicotianae P1976]ETP04233.1 hypothetical protein F441_18929 [Phytophthora nicotianae CJ01A1]ETL28136.1 hypothetical protein L916_18442 [Phytophthora nicotianae]